MSTKRIVHLFCMMLVVGGTHAMSDESKGIHPTISVIGVGRVVAEPDVADVCVCIMTQAATAQEALSANNEAMTKLHALLKDRAIPPKDFETTQIKVCAVHSQAEPRRQNDLPQGFVPKIAGYRVDNSVQITSRRIDMLGELLDALVQAGANQIHGICFRVAEPEKLFDQARRRAVADARRKAEMLASEANVALGHPIKIHEESRDHMSSRPMMGRASMSASAMPVSAGEQETIVSVAIDYELIGVR